MYYFLTFRTYGTWLHGDERGSVDRQHNEYGEPLLERNVERENRARRLMKSVSCAFNARQIICVENTIKEVAAFRQWDILALAVLANHVHVVVSTQDNVSAERAMNDFKAWTTRRLRENGLIEQSNKIWERHGSTRHLRREHEVEAACDYVLNYQMKDV